MWLQAALTSPRPTGFQSDDESLRAIHRIGSYLGPNRPRMKSYDPRATATTRERPASELDGVRHVQSKDRNGASESLKAIRAGCRAPCEQQVIARCVVEAVQRVGSHRPRAFVVRGGGADEDRVEPRTPELAGRDRGPRS